MTQTHTIRLNITRATVIKLAIENYMETAKLNLSNDEYIELLKIQMLCSKHITQMTQNKTHLINTNSNKVV